MNCLLYCIFSAANFRPDSFPPGINGKPVVFVQHRYLCAALSPLILPLSSDTDSLLRYGHFINAVHHANLTILPFRYGMVLSGLEAVEEHLDHHAQRYSVLLTDFDGYSEMSIRFFHPLQPQTQEENDAAACVSVAASSGKSYLEQRRRHYAQQQQREAERIKLRSMLLDNLDGLYAQWREEAETGNKGELWSFYFLVPRHKETCFRRAVAGVRVEDADVSVSGPWPPYNFVAERAFSSGERNDSETFQ